MQIIKQTSTILELQVQKYFKNKWLLLAASSILFSIGLILISVDTLITLKCNRLESARVDCEIIRKNWLLQQSRSIEVTDLQSAEVSEEKRSGSNRGYRYRIILITKSSRIPLALSGGSGSQSKYDNESRSINSFIQASEPNSLIVEHDVIPFLTIIGVIVVLVFPVSVIGALTVKEVSDCIFDKELKKIFVTKRNLLKSEQQELMFSEVKKVKVTKNSQFGYILSLETLDGEDIHFKDYAPETDKYRNSMEKYNKCNNIAESINLFIDS